MWDNGHAVLVAWEDSPLTSVADGFADGEAFVYAVWDASTNIEYGLDFGGVTVSYDLVVAGDERFESDGIYVVSELAASSVVSNEAATSGAFALGTNYPNPFASSTTIRYQLASQGPVRLEVFNALGRRVALLVDEVKPAGAHEVSLDVADGLASGIYVYRIRAGSFTANRKMTVLG